MDKKTIQELQAEGGSYGVPVKTTEFMILLIQRMIDANNMQQEIDEEKNSH